MLIIQEVVQCSALFDPPRLTELELKLIRDNE